MTTFSLSMVVNWDNVIGHCYIWNNRMNRYVRRGSKGIALLDQSSSVPRLHYVFDVSDTGVRRNSRDPDIWQLGPDLVQPVSEMLAREYGVSMKGSASRFRRL